MVPSTSVVAPSLESRQATRSRSAAGWTSALVALAVAEVTTLYLFHSTLESLISVWYGSRTYSYGFVILPLAGFLAWQRRAELKRMRPSVSMLGMGGFVALALVWEAGNIADVQVVEHAALVGMIAVLVWTFLGWPVAKVLKFPLSFLALGIPVGQSLVPPLQQLTASFTVHALRLSGIPAVGDGLYLSTPSGNWLVAEACSGIRYLSASVVIGILFAGVAYRRWRPRIIFVAASAVVPVIANAVRAYGIVALGYFSNNQLATGVDHIIYGWVFFSATTAVLVIVGLKWSEPREGGTSREQQPRLGKAVPRGVGRTICALVAVGLVGVSATASARMLWTRSSQSQPAPSAISAPDGWVLAADDPDHQWAPEPSTIEWRGTRTFVRDNNPVSVYEGIYPAQPRGVELVSSSNVTDPDGDWRIVHSGNRKIKIGQQTVAVSENTMVRDGEHRLVWMWYSVGGNLTANSYRVKVLEAKCRLLGCSQATKLVAVSAPFNTDPSQAVTGLSEFLEESSSSSNGK